MKRILVVISILAFVLAGCGKKGKPDDVPQEVYDALVPVVTALDDYIKGDSSIGTLRSDIESGSKFVQNYYSEHTDLSVDEKLKGSKVLNTMSKLDLTLAKSYLSVATDLTDNTDIGALKEINKTLKNALGM